jgi:hypothetical protein
MRPHNISSQRTHRPSRSELWRGGPALCGLPAEAGSFGVKQARFFALSLMTAALGCSSMEVRPEARLRAARLDKAAQFVRIADIRIFKTPHGSPAVELCPSVQQVGTLRSTLLRCLWEERRTALIPTPKGSIEGGVPGCIANDYRLDFRVGKATEYAMVEVSCNHDFAGGDWLDRQVSFGDAASEMADLMGGIVKCQ